MEVSDNASVQFRSVQSLSRVQPFATPWIAARQASLSILQSLHLDGEAKPPLGSKRLAFREANKDKHKRTPNHKKDYSEQERKQWKLETKLVNFFISAFHGK